MGDYTCLGENMMFPASFEKTGINSNEVIVGATGSGKTFSNVYGRLLHTNDSSVVVQMSKKSLKKKFIRHFKNKGYKIIDIDFTDPAHSEYGYDPFDYIHTEEDIVQTARNLVFGGSSSKARTGESDPYWNESAVSVIGAYLALAKLNAKDAGKTPCLADAIKLQRSLVIEPHKPGTGRDVMKSNLDGLFEDAEWKHPGNQASRLWKTVGGLARTTASCIMSIVNAAVDKIFSDAAVALTKKKKRVSFRELGEKKVALFITSSPVNLTLKNFINMMYADMIKELFQAAEKNDGRLNVPVHMIFDDFAACGAGTVANFAQDISIFRAAGMSATILLQSFQQLKSIYGESEAATILDNCDTMVYFSSMDYSTIEQVARRMNKSTNYITSLPLEKVVVFRRGMNPVETRRYQTLADPLYIEMMNDEVARE